jgi:hypothetical protein
MPVLDSLLVKEGLMEVSGVLMKRQIDHTGVEAIVVSKFANYHFLLPYLFFDCILEPFS